MKYINAGEILPESLLAELQKYAPGMLLYVPTPEKPKAWGENSGFRQKLLKRNRIIRSLYQAGKTISELAEDFFLSVDSIKKIVYGKQESLPVFSPDTASAASYSEAGMAEEWVRLLLKTCYASDLPFDNLIVTGLVKIPLRLIRQGFVTAVGLPVNPGEPVVVTYRQNAFRADFQPTLLTALLQERRNSCDAIILVDKEEFPAFWSAFGKHFPESFH